MANLESASSHGGPFSTRGAAAQAPRAQLRGSARGSSERAHLLGKAASTVHRSSAASVRPKQRARGAAKWARIRSRGKSSRPLSASPAHALRLFARMSCSFMGRPGLTRFGTRQPVHVQAARAPRRPARFGKKKGERTVAMAVASNDVRCDGQRRPEFCVKTQTIPIELSCPCHMSPEHLRNEALQHRHLRLFQ